MLNILTGREQLDTVDKHAEYTDRQRASRHGRQTREAGRTNESSYSEI